MGEPEPTGVGICRRFREEKKFCEVAQTLVERRKILLPIGNELRKLFELRTTDRGLHVGYLQIVPDVRKNVFVIVSMRERSQLPREALAAGVAGARVAPAIPSPVLEGADEFLQLRIVRQYAPPSPIVM